MTHKKRGQAAIFMVIAIIILLLGAFFFYTQKASLKKTELISSETAPVKNFIETCISNVARQGITILGLNGGYITFPEEIENNPNNYLQLGPVSSIKTPYWWHEGIESIPPENFIVKQIEDYIASNLDTCIEDFVAFSQQFDVKKVGELKVNIVLNENDVTVDVNYPMELINKLNQTTIKLENFKEKVPMRLKKIYETAKDIMEAENRAFFLEFKTIDLITLDENIPTTDIEASCNERVWLLGDIEKKLKALLRANLPYIYIVGSDFNENAFVPNPFGENTYKDSYFNSHYKWQISDKKYDNLKISFAYDEKWPMNIYARPSKDGLLKSNAQKGQNLLNFVCLHIWHFTYDVVYPVMATITDNAAGSEPYQFNLAFKVSIDHNNPKRESFAFTLFEEPDPADEQAYCNDLVNEITVYTYTNTTDQADLAHVNLTFACGIFTCNIGETEWLSFGAAAGLTRTFPYCVSGILRGKKESFEDAQMFIQTETPGAFSLYLKPVKEFPNYEVVKHDFDNPSIEKSLEQDEKVSIAIKSAKGNFESFGLFPDNINLPIKLFNDNHEYDLTIYLSDNDGLIGGYKLKWNVNADEVGSAKKIKFHVIEKKGDEDERFLFISGLDSYSEKVPQPELIG